MVTPLDRAASPWAPVALFALGWVPYLVVIEQDRAAFSWAGPLFRGYAVVMSAWLLGCALLRVAFPAAMRRRRDRYEAMDAADELARFSRREAARLTPVSRALLEARLADVQLAARGGDRRAVPAAVDALHAAMDDAIRPARRWDGWIALGSWFLKAFAAALAVRVLLVEPYKIPSGSMLPTLQAGDQVFVNKLVYGVRLPGLNVVPFPIVRRPARGDVIVFENPLDGSRDFIKRVVGVPGDRVEVVDEVVVINGQPQPRRELAPRLGVDEPDPRDDHGVLRTFSAGYEEELGGVIHATLQAPGHTRRGPPGSPVVEGPWEVPAGSVFVMGDNRDNSSDSRYGFGVSGKVEFVPYGHIKGKAMVIWLSLSRGGIGSAYLGGAGPRLDRLFLPVR